MSNNNTNNKKDEPMPYVYIRSKEHGWLPGRVLESDGNSATVVVQKYNNEAEMIQNSPKTSGITVRQQVIRYKDYENGVLPMQNVDDRGKLGDYEDMVNLPYLHEVCVFLLRGCFWNATLLCHVPCCWRSFYCCYIVVAVDSTLGVSSFPPFFH